MSKRGRKPFVEHHFNEFLQVNKKTLKGVSDTSEAFDIYSMWADNQDRSISQASFNKMFKAVGISDVPAKIKTVETRTKTVQMSLVEQFDTLENYVSLSARGIINSLFIYGLAGIGKSKTVLNKLQSLKVPYEIFSGGVKDAAAIAKILYDNRDGKVIVFDDFDSIFRNKSCVDILKRALSDQDNRIITWADSTKRAKKDTVPLRFNFTSSVIFISNSSRLDKNLKNRSKIVHIDADKVQCLEWVHAHFNTFLDRIPMNHKEIVYSFLKANLGKFKTMDYRTFKNAMVDFLICVEERGMSVTDSYWKKMVLANASAA